MSAQPGCPELLPEGSGVADGERSSLSACGLCPGARLELRVTQGQSPVSTGKRGWGLGKCWGSGYVPVLRLGFQKQSLVGGRSDWNHGCWGPSRGEIPSGLNLKKTPWKYKRSYTSRVSGFQCQWDGDQLAFPGKAIIAFIIPRLLSSQPELFNIPWHLRITSITTSLCVMALAGSSSVRDVSP